MSPQDKDTLNMLRGTSLKALVEEIRRRNCCFFVDLDAGLEDEQITLYRNGKMVGDFTKHGPCTFIHIAGDLIAE